MPARDFDGLSNNRRLFVFSDVFSLADEITQAELQELDSQILLTQGQGSSGGTMMMMNMNMNTPPAPMSPPVYHTQSSVSNSVGGGGGGGVGGGGGTYHSALSSQPSSLGSSNGYGNN